MLESIRLRLRADVPVGVYLSGGIDSSVIAGMVTHLVMEQGERMGNEKELDRVSCFSIAFDEESGFDESCMYCPSVGTMQVRYTNPLIVRNSNRQPDSGALEYQVSEEAYERARTRQSLRRCCLAL